MCEQCLTNPISFGEIIPGFFLMRARRDGYDWKKGEWGLVEANDPTFIFRITPQINDDVDPIDLIEFRNEFYGCYPDTGYAFCNACKDAGWDSQKMNVYDWFYNHIAQYIVNTPYKVVGDPFPNSENTNPSDLTITNQPYQFEDENKD